MQLQPDIQACQTVGPFVAQWWFVLVEHFLAASLGNLRSIIPFKANHLRFTGTGHQLCVTWVTWVHTTPFCNQKGQISTLLPTNRNWPTSGERQSLNGEHLPPPDYCRVLWRDHHLIHTTLMPVDFYWRLCWSSLNDLPALQSVFSVYNRRIEHTLTNTGGEEMSALSHTGTCHFPYFPHCKQKW